ncbi:MAG: hypothetical protein KH452_03030 [Clostridiales bacterium]|nr:hypothetical protein [Clostridiales bacterium]
MKKEEKLLDALGSVRDIYVTEAAPAVGKRKKRSLRWIAAVVVLVLNLAVFLQTAPGAKAAEYVREQIFNLIETLFPSREITAMPEGEPESNTYEARGREPETDEPGFAIYIDPEHYTMVEEEGIYYIRPLTYDPDSPLVCEMVIREVPDIIPMELAQQIHDEMEGKWESVTEIWENPNPAGISFNMSNGLAWDSMQESHYFVDNGKQGSFQIIIRYFQEATEGHGSRFYTMLETFSLIEPQDTAVMKRQTPIPI